MISRVTYAIKLSLFGSSILSSFRKIIGKGTALMINYEGTVEVTFINHFRFYGITTFVEPPNAKSFENNHPFDPPFGVGTSYETFWSCSYFFAMPLYRLHFRRYRLLLFTGSRGRLRGVRFRILWGGAHPFLAGF